MNKKGNNKGKKKKKKRKKEKRKKREKKNEKGGESEVKAHEKARSSTVYIERSYLPALKVSASSGPKTTKKRKKEEKNRFSVFLRFSELEGAGCTKLAYAPYTPCSVENKVGSSASKRISVYLK